MRSADGTAIAYDRSGNGPALVVVEGAFCDRNTTAPLAELLAPRFTVYAYDRRGRGDSGDTAPYAVDREIEDLAALLGEAGEAFVYGMSSGAALALEAAARGVDMRKLAAYEPPVPATDSGRQHAQGMRDELSELLAAGRRGDAVELFMTRAAELPAELVAGARHSPMWAGLEAIAHTLAYDVTVTGDGSLLTERAASITVPTLIMHGDLTTAFLRDATLAAAAAVPGAVHRTLEGQSHNLDPKALAPVLEDFFLAG
jgi:pimeloyl-ACP methyl ester carboxylesterase